MRAARRCPRPCPRRDVPEGRPPPPAAARAGGGAGVAGVADPRVHAARGLWHRGLAGDAVLQLLVQRVDLGGHLHHLALPGRGHPRQHLHLPLRQGPALHRRRGELQGAHGVGGEPAAQGRLHRHPQPGARRQRHLHVRRQEPARHRGQILAGHALRAGESAHPLRRRAGLRHRRCPAAGGRAGGPGLLRPLLLAAAPGRAAAAPQRHGEGEAAALGQGGLQARPAGAGALRHAGPRPRRQESQGRSGRAPQGEEIAVRGRGGTPGGGRGGAPAPQNHHDHRDGAAGGAPGRARRPLPEPGQPQERPAQHRQTQLGGLLIHPKPPQTRLGTRRGAGCGPRLGSPGLGDSAGDNPGCPPPPALLGRSPPSPGGDFSLPTPPRRIWGRSPALPGDCGVPVTAARPLPELGGVFLVGFCCFFFSAPPQILLLFSPFSRLSPRPSPNDVAG